MKTKFTILLFLLLSFQIGKSQFTVYFTSTEGCFPEPAQFTSFSSPTNATSWHWNFGDGDTSNVQNPIHFYGNSGTYLVQLISSDGTNTDSISILVDVFATPIADFTSTMSGFTVQFFDQSSSDAVQWYWDFGNGTTSNSVNPITTYQYPPDSCYNVTLTITNNLCGASLTMVDYICIDSTTSIHEIEKSSIFIYPSPIINNQKLIVKGNINGLGNIIGYDVLGNLTSFPIISKNENEIIFETNQLNKGVYFLQLHFDDGSSATKKIIVQ
jgi:PKD repeat protein